MEGIDRKMKMTQNKSNVPGCGVLFKSKAGNILTCGEERPDRNQFLCKRCLKEWKEKAR